MVSIDEYKALVSKPKKKNKYGAIKMTVNGITFDSRKEGRWYEKLWKREQDEKITKLTLQPKFPYYIKGIRIFVYKADFSYMNEETGLHEVVDVKGFKTPVYRLKKKIIEAEYGIEILEV